MNNLNQKVGKTCEQTGQHHCGDLSNNLDNLEYILFLGLFYSKLDLNLLNEHVLKWFEPSDRAYELMFTRITKGTNQVRRRAIEISKQSDFFKRPEELSLMVIGKNAGLRLYKFNLLYILIVSNRYTAHCLALVSHMTDNQKTIFLRKVLSSDEILHMKMKYVFFSLFLLLLLSLFWDMSWVLWNFFSSGRIFLITYLSRTTNRKAKEYSINSKSTRHNILIK